MNLICIAIGIIIIMVFSLYYRSQRKKFEDLIHIIKEKQNEIELLKDNIELQKLERKCLISEISDLLHGVTGKVYLQKCTEKKEEIEKLKLVNVISLLIAMNNSKKIFFESKIGFFDKLDTLDTGEICSFVGDYVCNDISDLQFINFCSRMIYNNHLSTSIAISKNSYQLKKPEKNEKNIK